MAANVGTQPNVNWTHSPPFPYPQPAAMPPLPLLITGISGVAGYNALDYFQAKYPGRVICMRQTDNLALSGPGIVAVDAEDRAGLARLFDEHKFQAVLDCAGNCALKPCQLDPQMAQTVNVTGIRNLLEQTVPRGIRLVHLSIDLVYSGIGRGGHLEDDPTDPVTVYGQHDGRRGTGRAGSRPHGVYLADLAADGSEF